MTVRDAGAARTAWVVPVPEAETLVQDLRRQFDPSAALGVPAHVTVLHPFMAPTQITAQVLDRAEAALRATPAFAFRLAQVACFADTAYLAPEPAAAFVALTEALVRAFPGLPPYGGAHATIVPHLTVGQGDADTVGHVAVELQAALRRRGPVQARCSRLSVLENAGGTWREMHRLALPPEGATTR